MFLISNFIIAIARVIEIFLGIFWWLLLVRVLVSWVSPSPFNPLVQFLYRTTEPILDPIRRFLPMMGMIDFSPIIAFILIVFLRSFLVKSLFDIAYLLR
jgi:YggT family protein